MAGGPWFLSGWDHSTSFRAAGGRVTGGNEGPFGSLLIAHSTNSQHS